MPARCALIAKQHGMTIARMWDNNAGVQSGNSAVCDTTYRHPKDKMLKDLVLTQFKPSVSIFRNLFLPPFKPSMQAPSGLFQPFPIQTTEGEFYGFPLVDFFLKMTHFIPLPGLPFASQLAQVVFKEVLYFHGLPTPIVSHHSVQSVSKFYRALCEPLPISLDYIFLCLPQSNGQYLPVFIKVHQDMLSRTSGLRFIKYCINVWHPSLTPPPPPPSIRDYSGDRKQVAAVPFLQE